MSSAGYDREKERCMPKKNEYSILAVIIALLFLAFIISISVSKSPLQLLPLIFVLAPIVFIITFVNTDVALILLIFSMLLSPEFKLADVPARAVVIRIDDILLFVVFFSWLAKMAINKEMGLLRRTPINPLIIAYIAVCIISTALGILTGHIHPLKSSFYILKYVEYFMLYFLVTNNIRDEKQIKAFIVIFFITGALTCIYAITTVGEIGRATAPFEGLAGEANTLGGYLVLLFAIAAGISLYTPSGIWLFFSGGMAFLIFFTLLQTLSRGSYLAFIFMYLALTILTRRKRLLLIGILIGTIVILPGLLPTKVTSRISATFVPGKVYEPLAGTRITLDESSAARVETWKEVFEKWKTRPFLGHGVTGVGFIDTQYPRVFGETGIIGFLIFIWLMATVFRYGYYAFNNAEDDWVRGLTLGFLAGFIGLLIHSFSASTFIIVRIMEPFWFLAAIVMMLPEIQKKEG